VDPRSRLSSKQFTALLSVTRGDDLDTVATRCAVSPRRVERWLKTPIFRRALLAERTQPLPSRLVLRAMLLGPQKGLRQPEPPESAIRREEASDDSKGREWHAE
jgi:hypothetical protein